MNRNMLRCSGGFDVLPRRCGAALIVFMFIAGFQWAWINQRSIVLAVERRQCAMSEQAAALKASLRMKTKKTPAAVQTGVLESVIRNSPGLESAPLPVFKSDPAVQAKAELPAEPPAEIESSVAPEEPFPSVNGVVEYQGKATVLIRDQYYEEGDFFQDYQIVHISPRAVTIINRSTAEVAYLYFSEEAERMKRLDQALKTAHFHLIVQKALDERMSGTGTFDLFDKTINRVRKLKLDGFTQEVQEGKDSVYVPIGFQDVIYDKAVHVIAVLKEEAGTWVIKAWEITAVEDMIPQFAQTVKLELYPAKDEKHVE